MIEHVVVVVPAADEEERIAACLDALDIARRTLSDTTCGRVATQVVVVLDGCRDGTAEIVLGHRAVSAISCTARCVGIARATGSASAFDLPTAMHRVWTAHTDADSQVPSHWLVCMVAAAERGADVVLGTVTPDCEATPATRRAWTRRHRLRDGHPHVHGANLGIRASTLHAIGGWAPLGTGEDVDLVDRAVAQGTRVVRTGAIPVRTSARAYGRAPHGFSRYLRDLAEPSA